MLNPYSQAAEMLDQIRGLAKNSRVDALCDKVEVLLGAYMDKQLDVDEIMGRPTPMRPSGYRIFCLLYKNLGRLVSNEAAMNALYFDDIDGGGAENNVKVQVHHLRKAIEGGKYRIDVEWGIGLRMVLATDPERSFFSPGQDACAAEYSRQFGFTERETALFTMLFEAKGETVSAESIAAALWANSPRPLTRMRTMGTQIREKMANAPFVLTNDRGVGYRLVYTPTIGKLRSASPVDVAARVEARRVKARKASNEWYDRHKATPHQTSREGIAA